MTDDAFGQWQSEFAATAGPKTPSPNILSYLFQKGWTAQSAAVMWLDGGERGDLLRKVAGMLDQIDSMGGTMPPKRLHS
jgi:hypothetical protein